MLCILWTFLNIQSIQSNYIFCILIFFCLTWKYYIVIKNNYIILRFLFFILYMVKIHHVRNLFTIIIYYILWKFAPRKPSCIVNNVSKINVHVKLVKLFFSIISSLIRTHLLHIGRGSSMLWFVGQSTLIDPCSFTVWKLICPTRSIRQNVRVYLTFMCG